MHGSFISSTKRELKTCVLFGTSSGVTTLSGMTTLKTSFSSSPCFCPDADSWESACLLVNVSSLSDTILTCSGCFPGCPRSHSTGARGAKGADVGGPCTGGACTEGAGTEGAGIGGACTEGAGTEGAGMGGACIRGTCLCGACIGSACTLGACVAGTCNQLL